MTTKNKKEKIIEVKTLLIPIFLMLLYAVIGRLAFLPQKPSDELERALNFERSRSSIGMTFEECEEIFGELGEFPDSHVLVVPAGYFRYQGFFSDTIWYEMYIYFDENQQVKEVMMRTISEA